MLRLLVRDTYGYKTYASKNYNMPDITPTSVTSPTVFPLGLGERHPERLRLERGRQDHAPLDVQLHHGSGVLQHLHRRGVVDILQREPVGAQHPVIHAVEGGESYIVLLVS